MVDLEHRVEILEQELLILKGQIQATLLEIQEQLLTSTYPLLRADEGTQNQSTSAASSAGAERSPVTSADDPTDSADDEAPRLPMVRRVNLNDAKSPAGRQPETPSRNKAPSKTSRLQPQAQDFYETEDEEEQPAPPPPVRRMRLDGRSADPELDQFVAPSRSQSQSRPQAHSRRSTPVEQSYDVDDDEAYDVPPRANGRQQTNDPRQVDARSKAPPPFYKNNRAADDADRDADYDDDTSADDYDPQPLRRSNGHRSSDNRPVDQLPFVATAEIPDWTALNRLAEWVGGKVKQLGKRRTRELIEFNAQKGHYTEEIKSVLLQLVALYEGDGTVITRRVDTVLESLSEPFARESEKFAPNDYVQEVDQTLVLKLIAGLQNAGAGMSGRKKRG